MIISRTPFRISFFGGGTDYPVWYRENGGAVLGTTIDKYCHISGRCLPPFFEHKSRIIYSKMEHVNSHADIDHPAVREVLKFLKIMTTMASATAASEAASTILKRARMWPSM